MEPSFHNSDRSVELSLLVARRVMLNWSRPFRCHFSLSSSNVVNLVIAQLLAQRFFQLRHPETIMDLWINSKQWSRHTVVWRQLGALLGSCESLRHCCWQFGRAQVWGQGAGIRDQLCRVRRVLTPDTGARTGEQGDTNTPTWGGCWVLSAHSYECSLIPESCWWMPMAWNCQSYSISLF